MDFVRKLLLKLNPRNRVNSSKSEKKKDNDDPANVMYETFEHGYKYPEVEIGCAIKLMRYRNKL